MKSHLEKRKQRLSSLLNKEEVIYANELKKINNPGNIDLYYKRLHNLTSSKETRRKELADNNLHQHWKINHPRLREEESKHRGKSIVTDWNHQIEEKQITATKILDDEKKLLSIVNEKNHASKLQEQKIEQERSIKTKQIAREQQQQILELKRKEEYARILKVEEQKLQESKMFVHKAKVQRLHSLQQQKQNNYGMFLIAQNKQNLLRKSRQIQEDLQNDLQLLNEIEKKKREELQLEKDKLETRRKDVEYMQSVLKDQLRVEKMRECELEKLYQQLSASQWRKRNSEWEMEKQAREQLMHDVLDERKKQIEIKNENISLMKFETIKEREHLLESLEQNDMLSKQIKIDHESQKKKIGEELAEQILARKKQNEKEIEMDVKLSSMEDILEEKAEDKLLFEMKKLTAQQCFRRRKMPFT